MAQLATVTARLSAASERARGRAMAIEFPQRVDRPQWFFSPELISIYNSPTWFALDETQRQELSFWEAVNFFSLNIHGEAALIDGLEARLSDPEFAAVASYLSHFIEEERTHTSWFRTFCVLYGGREYPNLRIPFPRTFEPGEEAFLCFARVVIFEEIVDSFNVAMAGDTRLELTARQINAAHHADERRHLAFGRALLSDLWLSWLPRWSVATRDGIQRYAAAYLTTVWRDYYNPAVYEDSGLPGGAALALTAWDSDAGRDFRRRHSHRCLTFLHRAGILAGHPL